MTHDLLVVSPTPTHPLDSGNRKRVYQLLTQLKERGFRIHFCLYNVANSPSIGGEDDCQVMAQDWSSFQLIRANRSDRRISVKLRRRLLNSSPYRKLSQWGMRVPLQHAVDDLCGDELVEHVAQACRQRRYCAVLVEYVFLSRVLEVVPRDVLKVIDTHDVFADRHRRLVSGGMTASFFTTTPSEEVHGLCRADVVVAIQQHEQRYFSGQLPDTVDVLEVAHSEEERFLERDYTRVRTVGLLGSDNDINIRSTQAFCDQVGRDPKLNRTRVLIGGNVCRGLRGIPPNVTLLGVVDSLANFYAQADVCINPMLAGTGLKIKTVEALSYGVPLLSTEVGTEGIEATEPYHRFSSMEGLVEHLREMVESDQSLKSYQEASHACFRRYAQRIVRQVDQLATRIRSGRGANTAQLEPAGDSSRIASR